MKGLVCVRCKLDRENVDCVPPTYFGAEPSTPYNSGCICAACMTPEEMGYRAYRVARFRTSEGEPWSFARWAAARPEGAS